MTRGRMKNVILSLVFLSACRLAYGAGAAEDYERGNKAFSEGKYADALAYYEKTESSMPESPYVNFAKGTAYFKQGDFEKAKEAFEKAATKTKDVKLEALANYNLGNCQFQEGQRQKDSDLKKAVESFQNGIKFYQSALALNKDLSDAAQNIEVTRLIVKDLLDKLKKQQEENKGDDKKTKEIIEKLKKLIVDQSRELDNGTKLSLEKDAKGISAALKENIGKVRVQQAGTRKETIALEKEMEKVIAEGQQAQAQAQQPQGGNPMETAKGHVKNAAKFQQVAENGLLPQTIKEATDSQKGARDELVKALEALAKPQDQDQQQDQDKKDEQDKKEQDQKAKDVLNDEKENKDERQARAQARYSAPDKDW